eukprot:CAMPEP_0202047634 /NCGR_PEP_ID=MMETSP0963-20130614/2102_1 /ASSEMBLY_ACC=CAM_ASM_000494 /TAXON_ID=4773 /ORGANISM="Schizochytrium aggregatum, Strain ATCC28209" /LENGTH=144 /DNA_ID=CAMNT_0048612413 /DNA_START=377 /DNA_END=812 /DNA_ORIENTATION=+
MRTFDLGGHAPDLVSGAAPFSALFAGPQTGLQFVREALLRLFCSASHLLQFVINFGSIRANGFRSKAEPRHVQGSRERLYRKATSAMPQRIKGAKGFQEPHHLTSRYAAGDEITALNEATPQRHCVLYQRNGLRRAKILGDLLR